MNGLITAFLIVGGGAGIGFFITQMFGGKFNLSFLNDLFKKKKKQVAKIEEKQENVVKQVIKSKKIAEEKKKEIKKIREKSNKEIIDILEKEDLAAILLEEEEIWNE